MNIFSKSNKDIAAVAAKVMSETPAKLNEYKPSAPIESDLVDRVVKAGMNTKFDISKKNLKEYKVLWNAREDDMTADQNKTSQKLVLKHTPKMPKASKPLEHTKSTNASAEDGTMSRSSLVGKEHMTHKESIDAGLNNNYAIKMPGVIGSKKKAYEGKEESPFEGGHPVTKHVDQFGNPVKNVAKHLAKQGLARAIAAKRKKESK